MQRRKMCANAPQFFLMVFLVIIIYIISVILRSLPLKFPKFILHPSNCSIFYGGPGSGKTTMCCYYARKAILAGIPVYSNVPITGCYMLDKSDLGKWSVTDGLVLIDEAGISYNNRDFRSNFSGSEQSRALEWWKKHRHEGCECMIFSQGFDDMDKKLQTLGSHYYIVRQSLFGNFIVTKRIKKSPQIDKMTHQPIDEYSFMPFSTKRVLKRPLWKYFDSFDRMNLPVKEFPVYGQIREGVEPGSDSGAQATVE